MIVKELIKSLEHFDEQEDIKNTFLFTEEKVYKIIIKENEDDVWRFRFWVWVNRAIKKILW